MNAGLSRFESTWLADVRSDFSDRPAAKSLATKLVWLPVVLIAGFAAWMVFSNYADNNAGSQPARKIDFATAAAVQPSRLADTNPALDASQFNPTTATAEAAPLDGLKIASQSWRRGGLGSKALLHAAQ